MDNWGVKKSLDSGKQYCARIGPLMLWFKCHFDEIQIAADYTEPDIDAIEGTTFSIVNESKNESLKWKRWIVGEKNNSISILPAMPDRPVVVRPDVPVKIPEGKEALFFVSIPIWVKIIVNNAEETTLCKEPSSMLSNIWFGDPMSGELCYSLRTAARRQVIDTNPKPHSAVCPVRIRNTTNSQLDVDRFCIHVDYLNIYRGAERLWTNEVCINFRGEDTVSKIDYIQEDPDYEKVDEMICKAARPWGTALLEKGLKTFKVLTGF